MLFQYGSNMCAERLRSQIDKYASLAPPGTSLEIQPIACARLRGWRLAFDLFSRGNQCLVADIVEGGTGDETWGGVYELDRRLVVRGDGKRSVLDRIEGRLTDHGNDNYDLRVVDVELSGALVEAHTYVGIESARARCRDEHPGARLTREYSAALLDGARDFQIPGEHIAWLRANIDALTSDSAA
jgi:hypothetical protein